MERPDDVAGQIPEPQRGASLVLEPAVDRFCRPVACLGSVEVGEHINSSAFQRSPERGQNISRLFRF